MEPMIIAALLGATGTVLGSLIGAYFGKRRGYDAGESKGFESGSEEGVNRGKEEGLQQGKREGYEQGFKEGRRHSILKFLDVHESNISYAVMALKEDDRQGVRASVLTIVETVHTWRGIQSAFSELLNGLVDRLKSSLEDEDPQSMSESLLALQGAFPAQRLAIETELERSKI